MDPIATALAAAWLDAVRRVQSGRPEQFGQGVGEPGGERQLTDIIEGGLESAGAAPLRRGETGPQAGGPIERPPIRLLDVLA